MEVNQRSENACLFFAEANGVVEGTQVIASPGF